MKWHNLVNPTTKEVWGGPKICACLFKQQKKAIFRLPMDETR